ncbi:hypothetical protein HTZ84_03505 [Haloterrigena sp. SYSU A558-1]|uniref:Uncharacterized protein n=1 Tax=Haloterrigena gelatinilytica TaxID=2741724 RepID=A0A8J8GRM6_9EURY|nr:hypothetical protein [Haloterrigena gelatinilytica]NUB92702.1 hypothetical protein [Haloterrigena gelatinilytica]NUC71382.1 hypothetical protein [Haloterrigena gelatinilytica]
MGIIERIEDEYLDVSTSRATLRELLELLVGAILFVLVASGLASYLVGETAARYVAAVLAAIFAVMLVSQAYWAMTGREDYD